MLPNTKDKPSNPRTTISCTPLSNVGDELAAKDRLGWNSRPVEDLLSRFSALKHGSKKRLRRLSNSSKSPKFFKKAPRHFASHFYCDYHRSKTQGTSTRTPSLGTLTCKFPLATEKVSSVRTSFSVGFGRAIPDRSSVNALSGPRFSATTAKSPAL